MSAAEQASAVPPGGAGTVNTDNPWPGLLAFRETDQGYFQGRRSETEELFRLVMRERLIVFFGLSGLGKSSLLQAGLFPRLRQEQLLPVYLRLDFSGLSSGVTDVPDSASLPGSMLSASLPGSTFSPGRRDLGAQVSAAIAREAAAHQIEAPAATAGETLWEYFHRDGNHFWTARNRPVMPLLVFDQFEEIFTLGRLDPDRAAATEAFLDQLADLSECRPPAALKARIDEHPDEAGTFQFGRHHYKVLLGVREDFLPDLEALRTRMPSVALTRLRLRRMNGDAALQVVSQAPHLIDAPVAEQVVRFVAADRRSLPLVDLEVEPALLSVVCRELNNKRVALGEPKITAALLEGSQEQVLTEFYERSMSDLPSAVRFFVEDHLLTVSGYRDSVALENALSAPGVSHQSIDQLVERRLVRREDRGGAQRLELTHDLLAGVVRVSRDSRRQREKAEAEQLALLRAQQEQQQALLKAQREGRRLRLAAAVFLVLGVAAAGAAVWALLAQRDANREREFASTAWSRSSIESAADLIGNDRAPQSLGYLAQAVRVAPNSVVGRNWIADVLLRRTWWLPHPALQHKDAVFFAAFSPDGRHIVTASRDHTAQVWDARSGKPTGAPMQHQDSVISAAFSADGRRLATASFDDTAQVWDAQTGQPIGAALQHRDDIRTALFSPDGQRVVTASLDNTAQVWDAATGTPVGPRLQHKDHVWSARFSPDGRRVVTASYDHTVQVWDAETGTPLGAPLRHEDTVWSAAFSPDGRFLVTASKDMTAQVWLAETGERVGAAMRHKEEVNSAAFNVDGRRVVTASDDGTAQVWEAATGKPVGKPLQHESVVFSAAFSADGRWVVTASNDTTARVWEADTGNPVGTPLRHKESISSASFSPDGRSVLIACDDGTARVWDSDIGKPVPTTVPVVGTVLAASFSAEGRRLVAASFSMVQVWDMDTGKTVGPLLQHAAGVQAAAFSADGRHVVTATQDGTAQVWEVVTGKPEGAPVHHKGLIESVAFSPDGRRIVTASRDHTALVWDVGSGKPVGAPLQHKDNVASAIFSPDGRRVVTASEDTTAQVWDAETGKPVGPPLQQPSLVLDARFSADQRRVVTAGDGTAQVWEAETGRAVGAPVRSTNGGLAATFSPDGRRIVTASSDSAAQVWEAETGKPVGAPMQHDSIVLSAAFSADGRRVVTVSKYGPAAQVWDAETGKPVGGPLPLRANADFATFSPDGRQVLTAAHSTAQVWDVLIDSGTREDTALLADLAEAVGAHHVNELGSLVTLTTEEQSQRLDALRGLAARTAGQPGTLTWFLRRFFSASDGSGAAGAAAGK